MSQPKQNEKISIPIDVSAADQTADFNAILVTVTGTLKYDDHSGNAITIAANVPVGKLEVSGTKIYKIGTGLTGILLQNIE